MSSSSKTIYAKDHKCTRCKEPKRAAEFFVGLNDPDGTQYPMCREHADEWKLDVMLALCDRDHQLKPTPTPTKGKKWRSGE